MVTEATWVEKAKATYELTKDKAVKIGGAVLVGAGVFASTACGGGSEAAPAGVNNVAAAEAINVGNDADAVIYGDACNNVENKYTIGKTRTLGLDVFSTKEQLLDSLVLFDGTRGSSTETEIVLTDEQADQYWESYQAALGDATEGQKELTRSSLVAYGEEIPGSNGTDAKLNVKDVCASIISVHAGGRPSIN